MRRKLAILILVVFGFLGIVSCYRLPTAKAVIWIEGHITSDTTWAPVDMYRVVNTTYVDPAVTLTILPGVRVQFADSFSLIVEGSLNATGTDDNPIIFTSSRASPSAGAWDTIKFKGGTGEQFLLKHVKVEYAIHGITLESTGKAIIEDDKIHECSESGVHLIGESHVLMNGNTIRQNKDGLATTGEIHSGINVSNNHIYSNERHGIFVSSDASGSNAYTYNMIVSDNYIHSNEGSGIYVYSHASSGNAVIDRIVFSNNTVSTNGGAGISLHSYGEGTDRRGYLSNTTISSNTVCFNKGNGLDLHSQGSSYSPFSVGHSHIYNVIVSNNTLSSNGGTAISLDSYGECVFGDGYGYIYNVIVSNNSLSGNDGAGINLHSKGHSDSNTRSGYGYIYNVTVLNNLISSNGGTGTNLHSEATDAGGGWSYTHIYNVTISTNRVFCNDVDGIKLFSKSQEYSYVHDITVSGNTVLLSNGTGMYINSYGFEDSYAHDVKIISNILSSNGDKGIHVEAKNHNSESAFDLYILDDTISGNYFGVWTSGGIRSNVNNNSISYNIYGVNYSKTANNLAQSNDIYDNSYGMNVANGATVNAERNYWGHPTGPYHSSLNPEGEGNPVNGDGTDLDFIPFHTSPQGHINERPIAALSVDHSIVDMNETVTLDASNSTDDRRIDYYFFDFGDGTNSSWTTFPVVTHKYASKATYNATLIVMDNYGITSLDSNIVYVTITVIPEFPSILVLPLFIITTLVAIIAYRQKHSN